MLQASSCSISTTRSSHRPHCRLQLLRIDHETAVKRPPFGGRL
jgi:hypothetical protein